jgi:hypothetical protein
MMADPYMTHKQSDPNISSHVGHSGDNLRSVGERLV